jgi:hypothetical protein
MTWKRAAVYWLGFIVLAAYYRAAFYQAEERPVPQRVAFVDVARDSISAVDIERAGQRVHAERDGQRWRVTAPANAALPSDLIEAVVASLTDLPEVAVVAENPASLAEFGLDAPAITLTLTRRAAAPYVIRFGQANPTGTALYAQRGDAAPVVLIGLNIRYYLDLLFAAP